MPRGLVNPGSGYSLVYEADAGALRAVLADGDPLTVDHTPTGPTPPDCAHASVYWPLRMEETPARSKRLEVRSRLADLFRLVEGTIALLPPN